MCASSDHDLVQRTGLQNNEHAVSEAPLCIIALCYSYACTYHGLSCRLRFGTTDGAYLSELSMLLLRNFVDLA